MSTDGRRPTKKRRTTAATTIDPATGQLRAAGRPGLHPAALLRNEHNANPENTPIDGALNSATNKSDEHPDGYAQCHHLAFFCIRYIVIEYANSNGGAEETAQVNSMINLLYNDHEGLLTIAARTKAKSELKRSKELFAAIQAALKDEKKNIDSVATNINDLIKLLNRSIPNLLLGDQHFNGLISHRIDARVTDNADGTKSLTGDTKKLIELLESTKATESLAILPVTKNNKYLVGSTLLKMGCVVRAPMSPRSSQIIEKRGVAIMTTPPSSPRASSSS